MRDRTGWTRGDTGPVKIGVKSYKNLTQFTRKCAACSQPFSIYVTPKIAEGLADSNNFGLKNCETHRRGGVPATNDEIETLRSKDRVMADELSGLYATIRDLQAKLDKATAAQPQPAVEAKERNVFPWK